MRDRDHDHSPEPGELRSEDGAGSPPPQGRRDAGEAVAARRAYRLRHLLAKIHMPLFLALAVLFGVWASRSHGGSAPNPWALGAIAILFAVLALLALADSVILREHRRRHRTRR